MPVHSDRGRRAAIFLLPLITAVWPARPALATDSDMLVTNVGGRVTIGGANNLEEAHENFELTSQIFHSPMVPGFPPFDPHDFGHDDPGFFALGSDRAADFPAGATPLPSGASVTVHFPSFSVAGRTDTLFYWNGTGTVNFQPVSLAQPGFAIGIGANPLGPTSSANPPTDTSFGALHEHPGFTIDNGGPGTPADGVYLNAANVSVTGLADSKNFYMVWTIDSLISDGDKADELRDAILERAAAPIVEGKDFSFVNNAIGYVQSNLVAVPEPPTLLLACALLPSLLGRGRGRVRSENRHSKQSRSVTRSSFKPVAGVCDPGGTTVRPASQRPATAKIKTALDHKPHKLFFVLASALIASIGVGRACAQHLDVLTQQQNGQLVTGTGDFDHDQWTLGLRVFHRDFGSTYAINNPGFNSIGVGSPDMPAGAQALPANSVLSWDFLPMTIGNVSQNLFYWNGQDSDGVPGSTPADVQFGALPTPAYTLTLFDLNNAAHTVNGSNTIVAGGPIDTTATDGFLHRHLFFFLQDNDGDSSTTPADGLYLLALHLKMPGLATSLPVFMIFGTPGSAVSAEDDAALPWVEQQLNLPGDFNQDGVVDAADYVLWRNTKGQTGTGLAADGNYDQTVDQADYNLWRANFGRTSQLLVDNSPTGAAVNPSAMAAPEPSAMYLVCMASVYWVLQRQRHRSRFHGPANGSFFS